MGTLDRSPDPEYHHQKIEGDTALEQGKFADARVRLEGALEALQAYYQDEKALIDERLAAAKTGLMDEFLEKAAAAREAGDDGLAEEAYDDAFDVAPDAIARDRARLARGEDSGEDMPLSAHLRGLYEKTLADPKDPTVHYNFAIELALDGFLDAAASQLEDAVDLTEDSPDTQAVALFRLGNVYFDLERFDEATGCYERALEQGYDKADVHYRLGSVYDWNGAHEDAQREYLAGLEENPEHIANLSAMGDSLSQLENYEGSLEFYQRLHAVDPEDEENLFKIASLLLGLGASEDAAAAFEQVIELDPDGEFAGEAQASLDEIRG